MTAPTPQIVLLVREAFAAHADPARAAAMSAYMRDQFPFFGLGAALRRTLQRQATAGLDAPSEAILAETALRAWAQPERELQYFGADYLRAHIVGAGPGLLQTVEPLIQAKSWWDTVDDLASHTVGTLVATHPALRADMDRWLRSGSLWLVRAALLHQLTYRQRTDRDWLFAACAAHAGHGDFFVRKAIGWALRSYAASDPDAVETFVAGSALSPLSRREALRGVQRARAKTL